MSQYSILLGDEPVEIPATGNTKVFIQAQGGSVCYRLGLEQKPIDGFTLTENSRPELLPLPLTVWAFSRSVRVVILEGMDAENLRSVR
jgi:hypothetical protein